MRKLTVPLVFLSILMVLVWNRAESGSGSIVYGGWNDIFVIDMETGKAIKKIPIGSRLNDIECIGEGKLLAASRKGLHVVDTKKMEVVKFLPLGILDSVEHDVEKNITYVMLHPGKDPNESGGPHILLKLSGDDFSELERLTLEPWIYEMFLEPSGRNMYITQISGRTIMRVDTDRFTSPERLYFGKGEMWEGKMVLLRHIAFSDNGRKMYVLEQGESDSTCLWNFTPASGRMDRTCLGKPAMIQGIVASSDGSKIFANGIKELIIFGPDGKEISRTDLEIEHRWIAMSRDGGMLYLTSSIGEHEGRITCVDTEGNVVRKVNVLTPLNIIAVDVR